MHFPLRNFKSGKSKRTQVWPDVFRHSAKIFANHARGAGIVQHDAQIFFAVALVSFTVVRCFVVSRNKMGRAAAGLLEHLLPIEREKLFVLPWPPRESINAIKSQHMVDPKEMKNAADCAHTLAPPRKIVRAHPIP